MLPHIIEPDGFCQTCRTVGCLMLPAQDAPMSQLDRVEFMLRALCREAKIQLPWDETETSGRG